MNRIQDLDNMPWIDLSAQVRNTILETRLKTMEHWRGNQDQVNMMSTREWTIHTKDVLLDRNSTKRIKLCPIQDQGRINSIQRGRNQVPR